MLVYAEVQAFSLHLMATDFGTKAVSMAFLMSNESPIRYLILRVVFAILSFGFKYILPAAAAAYAIAEDWIWGAGLCSLWLIYNVIVGVIRIPFRWKTKRKNSKLLFKMLAVD